MQFGHAVAQHLKIGIGFGHLCGDGIVFIHFVGSAARAILDVLEHGLARVQFRLLLKITDGDVLAGPSLTRNIRVDPGHDLDERGFTCTVRPDDTDLRSAIELQIDIRQHRLARAGESLGHVLHDICVLSGHLAGPSDSVIRCGENSLRR